MKLTKVLKNIVNSDNEDDLILFLSIYFTAIAYPNVSKDFDALTKILDTTAEATKALFDVDMASDKLAVFGEYLD